MKGQGGYSRARILLLNRESRDSVVNKSNDL